MFDFLKFLIKSVLISGAVLLIIVILSISGLLNILLQNREGASAPFFFLREEIIHLNRILTTIKEY